MFRACLGCGISVIPLFSERPCPQSAALWLNCFLTNKDKFHKIMASVAFEWQWSANRLVITREEILSVCDSRQTKPQKMPMKPSGQTVASCMRKIIFTRIREFTTKETSHHRDLAMVSFPILGDASPSPTRAKQDTSTESKIPRMTSGIPQLTKAPSKESVSSQQSAIPKLQSKIPTPKSSTSSLASPEQTVSLACCTYHLCAYSLIAINQMSQKSWNVSKPC